MTLSRKVFSVFLLIFFSFVLLDLAFSGLKSFFASGNFGALFAPSVPNSNGLAEIDFAFFSKKESKNYISQGYGATYFSSFNYIGHRHNGIDIVAKYGAPVLSAAAGKVLAVGNQDDYCFRRGFGKFVAVKSAANDFVMFYAHLGAIKVKPGSEITRAGVLGSVGASGFETGTHLHFSVFDAVNFQMKNKNGCGPGPDGKDLNPIKYLPTLQ